MQENAILRDAEGRMKKAVDATAKSFSRVQTGRASASLLDGVFVNYYGTKSPLNQVGTVTTPEPRLLMIQPWDKSIIKDIEKAIATSDLGLNPNSDGSVIRIQVPELTTERREELTKYVSKLAEEGRISIRNIRRDANNSLKRLESSSDTGSKESRGRGKRGGDKRKSKTDDDPIQSITDKYIDQIDQLLQVKEDELLELS
jgi:ribosome recycling factor